MLNWILAAGLVLSVATQLRLGSMPVGAGELLLLLWAGLVWVQNLRHRLPSVPPYVRPFIYFFPALILILSFANLSQVLRNGTLETYALHDTLAYAFLVFLGITFCVSDVAANARPVLQRFVSIAALTNGALLAVSFVTLQIGGITISNGIRFVGLSVNPNQLGQVMSILPLLCIYFVVTARSTSARLYYLLLTAISVSVGLATGSDAVKVCWWVSIALLIITFAFSRFYGYIAGRSRALHGLLMMLHLMLIGLTGTLVALSSPQMSSLVGGVVADVRSGDEGDRRLLLWQGAVYNMAKSPLIGLGGGRQVVTPYLEGAREAHNSYLDFTLATGFLGLVCFLALLTTVVLRSGLLRQPLLLTALASLLLFAVFHYIFRHPVFWFSFMLVATTAATRGVAAELAQRHLGVSGSMDPFAKTRLDQIGLRKPARVLVKPTGR